ncbi:unnamed protein product [Closterium sp. Yama58-4]|nr:unnamed protein product [Closterium sp. Yama58-4]
MYITHVAGCFFYYLATTMPPEDQGYTWIGSLTLGDFSYENFREVELFTRYVTALYWSVVTMATIGYGDIHPVNPREMIFAMFYITVDLILSAYLIAYLIGESLCLRCAPSMDGLLLAPSPSLSLTLGDFSYENFREVDLFTRYVTALYWSVVTMATIGYGDIHPVNPREMIFAMFYITVDLILSAYLIGNITALVVKGSNTTKYRERMAQVIKYMNPLSSRLCHPFPPGNITALVVKGSNTTKYRERMAQAIKYPLSLVPSSPTLLPSLPGNITALVVEGSNTTKYRERMAQVIKYMNRQPHSPGNITALVVKGSNTTKYRERMAQVIKYMNRNRIPRVLKCRKSIAQVSLPSIHSIPLAGNITALVVKGSNTTKYRERMAQVIKYMNRNRIPRVLKCRKSIAQVSLPSIHSIPLAGNITALVVKGSNTTKYRERMAQVIKYMNRNRIPRVLRHQMRQHVRLQFETDQVEDNILNDFPVSIRHKVARALYRRLVEQSYIFQGCSPEFINQISIPFSPTCPLLPLQMFGEVAVLCNIPQPFDVSVIEFCQVLRLERDDLNTAIATFMVDGRKIVDNLLERTTETGSKYALLASEITSLIAQQEAELTMTTIYAASRGDIEHLKKLIKAGANASKADYDGRTPLHLAAAGGYDEVVRFLLLEGADVNSLDNFGTTPLLEALRAGNDSTAKILTDKHGTVNLQEAGTDLCNAVMRGDTGLLRRLLVNGVNPNAADYDLRTPLHIASAEGFVQVARLLVEHGADVAALDRWGNSPLDEARRCGSLPLIHLLEEAMRERGLVIAQVASTRPPIPNSHSLTHSQPSPLLNPTEADWDRITEDGSATPRIAMSGSATPLLSGPGTPQRRGPGTSPGRGQWRPPAGVGGVRRTGGRAGGMGYGGGAGAAGSTGAAGMGRLVPLGPKRITVFPFPPWELKPQRVGQLMPLPPSIPDLISTASSIFGTSFVGLLPEPLYTPAKPSSPDPPLIQARAFLLSTSAHTALIAALARSGPYVDAAPVLAGMRAAGLAPTVHACTAAMQAQSRAGRWRAALLLLEEMRGMGLKPDTMAYNAVLTACGRAGRVQEVLGVYQAMQDDECRPSTGTRALLMSTFVRADRCDLALQLFFDARLAGQPVTPDMHRGLICVASKVGRWPLALDLLDDLLATWTDPGVTGELAAGAAADGSQATASADSRQWQLALSVFSRMKTLGIRPDHFTWSGLASALARAGEFDRAMALFEHMGEREGLQPTLVVCNCALLACQHKAKWQRALQLLWRMERMGVQADVRSYSMVIRTCELAGGWLSALSHGCALLACQHKAKWQRALQLLWRMERMGVQADVWSYSMVILCLSRPVRCCPDGCCLSKDAQCRLQAQYLHSCITQPRALFCCFLHLGFHVSSPLQANPRQP